ncbi:MAG: LD-carboxypeptidase [Acidobacteriia bacterium]|nr:LD-carboxypeptidase [Terriglobia bacterium]
MKMIRPDGLERGDTIGVVSPASPVLRGSAHLGAEYLRSLGFNVRFGRHAFDQNGYFSGNHSARLSDFNEFIRDPDIKAIFCTRGGYGAVYLLEKLDYGSLRRHPKIIMGASDLTILLNVVSARTGLITFHGPMVAANFSKGRAAIHRDSFNTLLKGKIGPHSDNFGKIILQARKVVRQGRANGRLVGGCLSLLVSTLGTEYEIKTRHSILFLEDVNEPPYRIDRMLKQLWDAGKFEGVRGVIFGDMLNCSDAKYSSMSAQRVITSVLKNFSGPLVLGLSSGHTRRPFVTLPIGLPCRLETRAHPQLLFAQAPVRE